MGDKTFNVLILCTGNSARSVMGECLVNRLGQGRFRGYSAGSQPKGEVHPMTLEVLKADGYDVSGLRSKSWDEFAEPDAPHLDFVFTVCGNAAGETCPVWPGQPMGAHWGVPDPAAANGTDAEKRQAFADAMSRLAKRVEAFCALPIDELDPATLKKRLQDIGDIDRYAS